MLVHAINTAKRQSSVGADAAVILEFFKKINFNIFLFFSQKWFFYFSLKSGFLFFFKSGYFRIILFLQNKFFSK